MLCLPIPQPDSVNLFQTKEHAEFEAISTYCPTGEVVIGHDVFNTAGKKVIPAGSRAFISPNTSLFVDGNPGGFWLARRVTAFVNGKRKTCNFCPIDYIKSPVGGDVNELRERYPSIGNQ